jgi:hypothetical protein
MARTGPQLEKRLIPLLDVVLVLLGLVILMIGYPVQPDSEAVMVVRYNAHGEAVVDGQYVLADKERVFAPRVTEVVDAAALRAIAEIRIEVPPFTEQGSPVSFERIAELREEFERQAEGTIKINLK